MPITCKSCGADILGKKRPDRCPGCGAAIVDSAPGRATRAQEGVSVTRATGPGSAAPAVPPDRAVTTELPNLGFDLPPDPWAILDQGSSEAGFSARSSWLACPERARLWRGGVKRKPRSGRVIEGPPDLSEDPAGLGTMFHALACVRVLWGHGAAESYLNELGLFPQDELKLMVMLGAYNEAFPLEREPFKYLGVEVHVVSDVGWEGRPVLHTVRYDKLIWYPEKGEIFGMDHKTSARGGPRVMEPYFPQFLSQQAAWNANPYLVEQYGRMKGVIGDLIVKSAVPVCERQGPFYFSEVQEQKMLEYLRDSERIEFPMREDGTYPKFFHTCYGRWKPCEYISLCWEGQTGDYETAKAD